MPGPGMEMIGEEEKQQVLEVLESGYLFRYGVNIGDGADTRFKGKVYEAERLMAELSAVRYAVATNSGSTALLTAMAGLGIGPGDEVIVPGYTFIASISAIVYAQAVPILAEIDETFNLDPADVEAKITPRTRAVVAVHMTGVPARLNELRAVADRHGLFLIEDCAQACGASYHGKGLGSIGDVGCFSFNVYKTITAGEGGMVVTDSEETYKRCFAFHDQGHAPLRQGVEFGKRPFIGMNFRFTELQAAVLIAQIGKLPLIKGKLRANKQRFKERIADLPGLAFREIVDADGDLGSMLTLILPDEQIARRIAAELDTAVVADAGWHVYNHMEQILEQRTVTDVQYPFTAPVYTDRGGDVHYSKGMLPKTDALLGRSLNIAIGVSDRGLSSGFGLSFNDRPAEIDRKASLFYDVAVKHL